MFGFIGDIHFEKPVRGIFEGKEGKAVQVEKSLTVLGRAFSLFEGEGIKDVVFGGDVFDTPYPSQHTLSLLCSFLKKQKGFSVSIIAGNHDFLSVHEHGMEVLDWVSLNGLSNVEVILKPKIKIIDEEKVWLCPHPYIRESPEKGIWSIGHFPWKGALRDNGSASPSGSCPKGEWLLGDFHTHQKGKRYEYAGSLTQLSRGESPNKGVLIAEDVGKTRFIPLKQEYSIVTLRLDSLLAYEKDRRSCFVYLKIKGKGFFPTGWREKFPEVIGAEWEDGSLPDSDDAGQFLPPIFLDSANEYAGLEEWIGSKFPNRGGRWAEKTASMARRIGKEA